MSLLETDRFRKSRERRVIDGDEEALKTAVLEIQQNPLGGKPLKGEFSKFRMLRFSARGGFRRLIYHYDKGTLTLVSLGFRDKEGI